jgi:hypothetical protein
VTIQLLELAPDVVIRQAKGMMEGVPGLAAHLLSLPVADFSAYALVPEGTLQDRALEFERGGFFSTSEDCRWLFERLRALGEQYAGGAFVVQGVWTNTEDHAKNPLDCPITMFSFNGSAYFAMDYQHFSLEQIKMATGAAFGFQILAAFTTHPLNMAGLGSELSMAEAEFEAMLQGIKEFYLNAYDGESFLILRAR